MLFVICIQSRDNEASLARALASWVPSSTTEAQHRSTLKKKKKIAASLVGKTKDDHRHIFTLAQAVVAKTSMMIPIQLCARLALLIEQSSLTSLALTSIQRLMPGFPLSEVISGTTLVRLQDSSMKF